MMNMNKKFICKNNIKILIFILTVILIRLSPITAKADNSSEVSIVSISYDAGYIEINLNGNNKVYYSKTNSNTWYEVEGSITSYEVEGSPVVRIIKLDISWISEKAEYSLSFKGDINKNEIEVALPASNTSLKVSFNKVVGELEFTNQDAENFEWRKSTSYVWKLCSIDNQADFINEMEQMMVKGGKIIVRIPGVGGTSVLGVDGKSDLNVGNRPSKSITISIPKRANGPSVKVDTNKLTLNTTDKMEYKIYSVAGTLITNNDWEKCDKKMLLSEITNNQVFATNTMAGSEVVIAIRKAATEKVGYSKTTYVTIPGQILAPVEAENPIITATTSKFQFAISGASSAYVFQYAVVKLGEVTDVSNWSWKNITSNKVISFSKTKYPEGSKIYVRLKGVNQSNKTALRLPSAYTTIEIKYLSESTE